MSFPQHSNERTTRFEEGYEGVSSFSTFPPSYSPRDLDYYSSFESSSSQPSNRSAPIPVPHATSQSIRPQRSPKFSNPLQSCAASSSYNFYDASYPSAPEGYTLPRYDPTPHHFQETFHNLRSFPGSRNVAPRQHLEVSNSAHHIHQNHAFRYSPPLREAKQTQDERTSCPYCLKVLWARGLQVHIAVCERAREALPPRTRTLSGQSRANPDISQDQAGCDRGRKRFPRRSAAAELNSASESTQPRRQICDLPGPTLNARPRAKPPSPKYLRHLP